MRAGLQVLLGSTKHAQHILLEKYSATYTKKALLVQKIHQGSTNVLANQKQCDKLTTTIAIE